jgi:hypothetical protein
LCDLRAARAPPPRFSCARTWSRKRCADECERAAARIVGICRCPARQAPVCATTRVKTGATTAKMYYNACMARCHGATVCTTPKCARRCTRPSS